MAISEEGLREVGKDKTQDEPHRLDETQDEPHRFVFAHSGSQNDSGSINPCSYKERITFNPLPSTMVQLFQQGV
ncbi:uncharacterized protein J3R85_017648 [Psidium guajava]|nr:uncharacterized protein J3R85_017648 [Psidium guajava]